MLGVEIDRERGGAAIRVWAPDHQRIVVVANGAAHGLGRDGGYHTGFVPGLVAGTRYQLGIGDRRLPDPTSRFQPDGPLGASQAIDARAFAWTDHAWRGVAPHRHVIYELHIGTFTPEGTWRAAERDLPYLAELGVTTLEVMPVAQCAGRWNWGYDGVCFFAPSAAYGTPDDMRAFVDRAHACGLAVILDVVYNHYGPVGNTLPALAAAYSHADATEWGDAPNFDVAGVREFVVENAAYWIRDFHLDGLRFDALQAIHDANPRHIIGELCRAAREAAGDRTLFLVGEDEPEDVGLLAHGLDALWNDDFHHTARVAATGVIEGYLHDYRGTPQELISAVKHGFLYQGQMYAWQRNPRGTPTRGIPHRAFVHFLENHDQVANIGRGERLADVTDGATIRALTALLLLSPELPMLFQGQEHGARQRWQFFVDHPDLVEAIRGGRADFMGQFPRARTAAGRAALPEPSDPETFARCKLDPAERVLDAPLVRLHRDLLRIRRDDPAFADGELDGAVLGDRTFALRFWRGDRLLLVNLGPTFARAVVPEPLVAPPRGHGWRVAWSSEDPAYGGHGTPPVFDRARLAIPAHAAVLLVPDASVSLRDPAATSGDKVPVEP